MFSILDGRSNFYQWDLNRKLIVNDNTIKEVHFCNRKDNCSLIVETYEENGMTLANVPNILLQEDWDINVYAYDGEYTKHSAVFEVKKRTRPADYIYVETEVLSWEEISAKLDKLDNVDFPIGTEDIKDKAITVGKLADKSVSADKIQLGSITSGKIVDKAITTGKVADKAITQAKLADDSVGSAQLRNNVIDGINIKAGAVATNNIADGAITTVKVANGAITADKIADKTITGAKLAEYTISNKNILFGAIQKNHIASKAVNRDKLADDVLELINNSGGGGGATHTGTTISSGGYYELSPENIVDEYVIATGDVVNFIVMRTGSNKRFNTGDSFIINTLHLSGTDGINVKDEAGNQQVYLDSGRVYRITIFNYFDWGYENPILATYISAETIFSILQATNASVMTLEAPEEEVSE